MLAATMVFLATTQAGAATVENPILGNTLDERLIGDLSSDIANPTPFTLRFGPNRLIANSGGSATGGATNGSDAEFLTVIVPTGLVLEALIVESRVGPGSASFIGWNSGATLAGQSSSDIFDGALFRDGVNLFGGPSASALDASLGVNRLEAGTYAFWIQETSGPVDYTLNFSVFPEVIPEPSTALLLGLGLIALGYARRR